ncbi:hypothetical protein [Methylobacterium sp. J-077]|uniref:hypothetical protein n=1 Tax=Methylobacterium sp. J-077 TaxID=2836656 RepID=UPI001FBB4AE1|nr:hypothetical protein [Methylobacterium sp. J-077]MCJ2124171.1 hypothetical protein [Methylobacterium sp. J-077]
MSVAILTALIASALCLGMFSVVIPLGPRRDQDDGDDEAFGYEDEFYDLNGPVIDMEPVR